MERVQHQGLETVLVEKRLLMGVGIKGAQLSCSFWASDPIPFVLSHPPSVADWVFQKQTLRLSFRCKIFIRDKDL